MTRGELFLAKRQTILIDFDVNKVRNIGILRKNAAPTRFGKGAAEPKAERRQFTISLATI